MPVIMKACLFEAIVPKGSQLVLHEGAPGNILRTILLRGILGHLMERNGTRKCGIR